MEIQKRLEKNIAYLEKTFEGCGDIVGRKIEIAGCYAAYVTYIDGLVDRDFIERQLVVNLAVRLRESIPRFPAHFREIINAIKEFGISTADVSETGEIEGVSDAMMSGDCVLLVEGSAVAVILSSKGWPGRGVGEPETEKALQGPKEAFTETMRTNTALIRRRIRDTGLKIKQMRIGARSKTDIAVVYIEGVVRRAVLEEAFDRLERINIDAILDSGYIEQLIEDGKKSPFPKTQTTERPDKAASAILEGRIAIIVDTSPFVILIPATFNMFFQSSEDYYQRPLIMSFLRLLRYAAGFASVTLPGLYIALTVYNASMTPSALAYKIAVARQDIPFPAAIEVIIMEIAFELLREAGVRLPGPIGGTLGIVGGLIMGQAAVEAGIVSPVVVIVVALGGIASFAIPQQSVVNGFRITKFLIIATSAVLGLFGFLVGVLAVLIHLVGLESFRTPYMAPLGCSDLEASTEMKDTLIRAPLEKMDKRPSFAEEGETVRFSSGKGNQP